MEKDLLLLPQHFGPNLKEYLRAKLVEKVGLVQSVELKRHHKSRS